MRRYVFDKGAVRVTGSCLKGGGVRRGRWWMRARKYKAKDLPPMTPEECTAAAESLVRLKAEMVDVAQWPAKDQCSWPYRRLAEAIIIYERILLHCMLPPAPEKPPIVI